MTVCLPSMDDEPLVNELLQGVKYGKIKFTGAEKLYLKCKIELSKTKNQIDFDDDFEKIIQTHVTEYQLKCISTLLNSNYTEIIRYGGENNDS